MHIAARDGGGGRPAPGLSFQLPCDRRPRGALLFAMGVGASGAVPAAAFLSRWSSSLAAQPAPAFQACRRSPTATPSGLGPSASGSTASIMQTRWRSWKVAPSRSRTETCTTSAQGGILARSGSPRGLILFGSTQARERHLSHSAGEANAEPCRNIAPMPRALSGLAPSVTPHVRPLCFLQLQNRLLPWLRG